MELPKALGHPNYAAIILVSLVCLVPLAVMLRIAVTPQIDWRQMPIDWLQAADWTAFERVLGSTFPRALLNSFLIALITTAIVVVLSPMGGHALAGDEGQAQGPLPLPRHEHTHGTCCGLRAADLSPGSRRRPHRYVSWNYRRLHRLQPGLRHLDDARLLPGHPLRGRRGWPGGRAGRCSPQAPSASCLPSSSAF